MKLSVLATTALLASSHAWKFTYRNADGKASTVSGEGPHACIEVDNEEGQLFDLDGQGEKNINMMLYTTSDCTGKAAGMATESFSKKSSVTIRGFKVVATGGGESTTAGTAATSAPTSASAGGNRTVSATTGPSAGKTVTESDATTAAGTGSARVTATATATASANASGSGSGSGTAPSETAAGDSGASVLGGNSVKVAGVVGMVMGGLML
ncbi:hypothetical protein BDV59DRAFT_182646 [Aspergillus ambiguus]|uniref:uncharacterized protein n=1 Tax=Aspergillus ambiguus TaxID=176160 RepID=UPI003CCDD0FC